MRASRLCFASVFLLSGVTASAQITINAADLQLGLGAQRSYFTHQSRVTIVTGLIMQPGGPRQWDFSVGVEDEAYCYEILPAEDSPFSDPFPNAELVELLTVDSDGGTGWTFYDLTPAGRELHGFYDPVSNPISPETLFTPPVVDYPSTINYLDQWSEPTSYTTLLDIGGAVVPVDVDVTITSFADAYGTLTLPSLGTVEVLRVNELSLFDSVADIAGNPVPIGQSYVRSYLWLSKEYGLVAQIASEGSSTVPPAEFEVASRFLRLSAITPAPVPPVLKSIVFDSENASVIVTWESVAGKSYQLEVSENLFDWNPTGDPVLATGTETSTTDGPFPPVPVPERFYRVRRLD